MIIIIIQFNIKTATWVHKKKMVFKHIHKFEYVFFFFLNKFTIITQ
jgi:hypothetical protein